MNHDESSARPIRVIFLCAAGMSSSLIKAKVEEAAVSRGIAVEMDAIPSMMLNDADYPNADVVLLGPQVRGQLQAVGRLVEPYKLPIEAIGFREYGMVDGAAILDQILRLNASRSTTTHGENTGENTKAQSSESRSDL